VALANVLAGLRGIVVDVTPPVAPTTRFVPMPPDAFDALDDWAGVRARSFDVAPVGAPFAGDHISAARLGYQSQRVAIRVAYPADMLRDRWQVASAATADAAAIYDAVRDPALWGSFALEVTPDVETQVQEIIGADGRSVALVAIVEAVAEWEV
jgi:hypothetical protein